MTASKNDKIEVENVNVPGQTSRVNAAKYTEMRSAILEVLPDSSPGMTHAELCDAVRRLLDDAVFPGGKKVTWWSKTVQLDLEAKRVIERENSKPLRWHRC